METRRIIDVMFSSLALIVLLITSGKVVDAQNAPLITQTVYGFLDFTTTIGNTLMIFSPNSAPPPTPEQPPSSSPTPTENAIETKPPVENNVDHKEIVIQPSKTTTPKEKIVTPKPATIIKATTEEKKEQPKITTKVSVVESKPKETKPIKTKVDVIVNTTPREKDPKEPKKDQKPILLANKVEVKEELKSIVTVQEEINNNEDDDEPAILVNNNIGEPEYDFLSRQPSEYVEETYKVVNIRPTKAHKQKATKKPPPTSPPKEDYGSDEDLPLGVVTTLGGTIVKDGLTTIHETKVIGTFISGKYAQVLQSSSKIHSPSNKKQKISPTPTLKILKTAAPTANNRYNPDANLAASLNDETAVSNEKSFSKSGRRPSSGSGFSKNRHRNNFNSNSNIEDEVDSYQSKKGIKNRNSPQKTSRHYSNNRASKPQLATVSVFSEPSTSSFSNRRKNNRNSGYNKTTTKSSSNNQENRRGFKPKVQASPVEPATSAATTSLHKFKLNRQPGRWQYTTTPKPRVTIRKIMGDDEPSTSPAPTSSQEDDSSNDVSAQSRSDNDLELSGSHNGPGSLIENDTDDNSIEKSPPIETIKVEISTPADFKDVYYEIATLRSPYTFQVGRVKNTRIVTVTTTIQKSIEPPTPSPVPTLQSEPLTENILATASPYDKEHNLLESSIVTLPPITLGSDIETPPLETIIDTFSTTQNMLKTHILPVVKEGNTSSYTFVQTYHVTRLVTATKTLPPMEFYQFIPSKTLKEFNSRLDEAGSELHLELEFGDSNEEEDGTPKRVHFTDSDLTSLGSDFDLSEVDKYRLPDNHLRLKKAHGPNNPKAQQLTEAPPTVAPALTPEQAQQLAILRLLNPAAAAQIPNVITTSKPVIKIETLYDTHVIPVFNGKATIQSTISRPVKTITKTEFEVGTSTLPAIPQMNPLFPQQPILTSTPVVKQTEVTATESQVLKLTFGAKTVFTTLYSTKVVPTLLTTYVTQSLQVQPSAQFPGYFPSPFAPFPYVG